MQKENNINWYYKSRAERSKWIAERFNDFFKNAESVIDVGCWEKDLQSNLDKNTKYTGIDIAGKPDIQINLDTTEKLPFSDKQFDVAVCTDVLEHLENIHNITGELMRITSKYIIITLPNPIREIAQYIINKERNFDRKEHGKYTKYYGLPLEKPTDRHRWFFSTSEAIEFIEYHADKNSWKIKLFETDLKYRKPSIKEKAFLNLLGIKNRDFPPRDLIFLLERKTE